MTNISRDPTHIYLDVNVCNNSISNENSSPQQIIFNSKRDVDYITNTSDYLVSVARFSLDCRLPVCVPQIDLTYNGGMFDPDLGGYRTIYSTTLKISYELPNPYTGSVYIESDQTFLDFRPQNVHLPYPTEPLITMKQVYDNRYFYIESVQYMMALVNNMFERAWSNLINKWDAERVIKPYLPEFPASALSPPFLIYNYDGNFTLNADPYLNSTPLEQGRTIELFLNSSLFTLFNGLSSYTYGYDNINSSNGKNHLIQFLTPFQTTTYDERNYIFVITEYPVVPFWSPISSIVFTSQGIPVRPTNVAPTNVFGNSSNLGSTNNNAGLSPELTDFDINLITGLEGRSILYYAPQGEYRFFDLNSNRPLSDINIVVYWKDKLQGLTHPMYISSGGAGTMKLLFRNKNYFKGTF